MQNLTTQQIENVVIDSGVVYVNYNETDERILAPCRGDNVFLVEQEFKEVEYNGMRGKTKGMRRVITENASLTVNLMDMSQENIKLALAGATLNSSTKAITNGTGKIASTEYLKNVCLVGTTMKGEEKVITLYNALADNGLSLGMVDKDESVVELAFAAHYDPTNLASPIYKIENVVPEV